MTIEELILFIIERLDEIDLDKIIDDADYHRVQGEIRAYNEIIELLEGKP